MALLSGATLPLLLLCILIPIVQRIVCAVRSPLRSVPGPFFARFSRLWFFKKLNDGDFQSTNIELHRRHGPVVRVGHDLFSISELDAAGIIYNSQKVLRKSTWYSAFEQRGQPNAFSTNDNAFAAEQRRKFKPAFDAWLSYEHAADECCRILERRFAEFADKGTEIDIGWWMTCYAFDTMGLLTYSKRFGYLNEGKDIDGVAQELTVRNDVQCRLGIYPQMLPVFWAVINTMTFLTKRVDYIMSFAQKEIDEHTRREVEEGEVRASPDMVDKFLAIHMKDPARFTEADVLIGAAANVIAGADTTWIALGGIMHHLHQSPTALKKLRDEVDELASDGKISDPVTYAETQTMPYLQAVIKEGQRMHPSTGLPWWRVVPEGGLTLCGRYFPAGTTIGLGSWVASRCSPAFEPDPDVFRPERWLEASKEQLVKMQAAHVPFGIGPRKCPGEGIALMEIHKVIPQLIRRFEFDIRGEWKTVNRWFVTHEGLPGKVKRRPALI